MEDCHGCEFMLSKTMLVNRRVKIVATMGPSTRGAQAIQNCLVAGMNVARLNFSHGTHAEHLEVMQNIRQAAQELKCPVAILQDLQGPKIRVGRFENGSIELIPNEKVCVTTEDVMGKPGLIPTDFRTLPSSCSVGTRILLDDGLLELQVESVQGSEIFCRVVYGGVLKDRKGMNVPGAHLSVDCLSDKDLKDLHFGLDQGVDLVALSFVRFAKDIRKLKEIIEQKRSKARVVAKIEMLEAVENLEEIISLSDAVMVARGDLAIEVGQTQLPVIQKRIIQLANQMGKPVITATQMLDSMVNNPRPTRAEVTDVANAVLDGSDAVMLSAESASGKFPFASIKTMHEIIKEIERMESNYYHLSLQKDMLSVAESIAVSASMCALKMNAAAIVCLTTTGKTAQIIASYRPKARLIAVTTDLSVLNQLEYIWGLETIKINDYASIKEVMQQVEQNLIEFGLAKTGDKVVLTYGSPVEPGNKTNTLQVFTLQGEDLEKLPNHELPLRCRNL